MPETDRLLTSFAQEVKEARDRLELTQEEFARLIGVSSKSVSAWERGLVVPRLSTRRRLARWFTVPEKSAPVQE